MPSLVPDWICCVHTVCVYVCADASSADPHRHSEWPWLLQLHYPSSRGDDPAGVKDYSVMVWTHLLPHLQVHAFKRGPMSEPHSLTKHTHRNTTNLETGTRAVRSRTLGCRAQPLSVSFSLRFESSNAPFISKRCPSFSSAAFKRPLSYFLSPSSPLLCFQTENVRWANAIHSLTKGKLGLLQQGSDRLVPEARFSFSLSPLTRWSALCFFFSHLLIHTHTQS